MGSPLLTGIDPPVEEQAISALLQTLRDDPTIGGGGTHPFTIWAAEGDREKLPEVAKAPEADQMPLIRVIIGGQPSRPETDISHLSMLSVTIEVFILGTHYADRMRALAAVRAALYPPDPNRRDTVAARWPGSDYFDKKITNAGTKTVPLGNDQFAQMTTFVLEFKFDIPTQS